MPIGSVSAVDSAMGGSGISFLSESQVGGTSLGAQPNAADPLNSTFKQLVEVLQSVSGEQASLNGTAQKIEAEGAHVTPGEMVMLSMECNEFLFHCELTANATNTSSTGLQQLFQEQS